MSGTKASAGVTLAFDTRAPTLDSIIDRHLPSHPYYVTPSSDFGAMLSAGHRARAISIPAGSPPLISRPSVARSWIRSGRYPLRKATSGSQYDDFACSKLAINGMRANVHTLNTSCAWHRFASQLPLESRDRALLRKESHECLGIMIDSRETIPMLAIIAPICDHSYSIRACCCRDSRRKVLSRLARATPHEGAIQIV